MFARDLHPPYYAVIFANILADDRGYAETADRMMALASEQAGCLGVETTRGTDGFGITVSYWEDEVSIANWKAHTEHLSAQQQGMTQFYDHYELRVARVERSYAGPEGRQPMTERVSS